jgi:hypothetical protein
MNEKEILENLNVNHDVKLTDGFIDIYDGLLRIWEGKIHEYNAEDYATDIHITFDCGKLTVAYTPAPHRFYSYDPWIDSNLSFGRVVEPTETKILPEYIQTKDVTILGGLFRTKKITNKIHYVPYNTALPTKPLMRKVVTTNSFRITLTPKEN